MVLTAQLYCLAQTAAAAPAVGTPPRPPPRPPARLLTPIQNLLSQARAIEAFDLLRPILARYPQDPDVLCLQASCFTVLRAAGGGGGGVTGGGASGVVTTTPQALAAYAGALCADPNHVRALLGCAALHKESGMLNESLQLLERAYDVVQQQKKRRGEGGHDNNTHDNSDDGNENDDDDDGDRDDPSSPLHTTTTTTIPHRTTCTYNEQDEAEIGRALAVVLTDLGTQSKITSNATNTNDTDPHWKQLYERAVRVSPTYAPAHYNLGVAAGEQGNVEAAMAHYRQATQLEPRYAEAWCNLGVLLRSQGRIQEAIAAYEAALGAGPTLDTVKTNLASALTEYGTLLKVAQGDLEGGIRAYERAIALRPRHAEALYNLGVAHTERGEVDRAIFMYEMAIAAAPMCAEAHNNLGVLHRERGNVEAAVRCYEAALVARPSFPEGLNNLAVVYTQQGRAAEAFNMLHAAIMAKPDYAEAYNNLGVVHRDVGAAPAAIQSYERCCELDPGNRNASQNRLLGLNYILPGEREEVCEAHRAWGEEFQSRHPPLPALTPSDVADPFIHKKGNNNNNNKFRPLVVGYISPDLFLHSVSYFAEAPLRHHRPDHVSLIVYSVCSKPDAKTERLVAAVRGAGGVWRDVSALSEVELAGMVRADKVDVLVELTGHTANNRLGTMARRPAPVQVTWIGYPNSTGLRTVEYRLTDGVCDPLTTTQTFTERLVRLPGCFLCYTPAHDAPPVGPLPAHRNGCITFGSFNALAKQTREVLRVWAAILRSIPGSRLVLKNKPFACEAVKEKFWGEFEGEGVERGRVDLLPLATATRDHLAQYGLIDIALDPWPYAGTTTTAEALYMGVPCLTLAGQCHAHNVGVSLLTAVGLAPDWVAATMEEYVHKAQQLSRDVEGLAEVRRGLRDRMMTSPLCDGPGFVDRLEKVYRKLFMKWWSSSSSSEEGNADADDSGRVEEEGEGGDSCR